jgi:hypothetical protein
LSIEVGAIAGLVRLDHAVSAELLKVTSCVAAIAALGVTIIALFNAILDAVATEAKNTTGAAGAGIGIRVVGAVIALFTTVYNIITTRGVGAV